MRKFYSVYQREPGLSGSLKSLVKRKYKTVEAVNDISFNIGKGELVGFIGPNGAGKTTTLKCLTGLLYPNSGKVEVSGFIPFERKQQFLKSISLVMGQKNQLWWDLPAMDTFLLNKEIYEIPDEQFKKTLGNLTDLLSVSGLLKTQVKKLSLGQRMKMELIAALIHSPKVLFLDEPTIGLDVVMQKIIRDFIDGYNKLNKSTVVLTSHYMEDVKRLAKRVIIIDQGRIIYDGKLDNLVKRYAKYKLLSVVLDSPVDREKLSSVGEVVFLEYPKTIIKVNRRDSNMAAARLLENFPVDDLNIEEPDIEEVIRDVFQKNV